MQLIIVLCISLLLIPTRGFYFFSGYIFLLCITLLSVWSAHAGYFIQNISDKWTRWLIIIFSVIQLQHPPLLYPQHLEWVALYQSMTYIILFLSGYSLLHARSSKVLPWLILMAIGIFQVSTIWISPNPKIDIWMMMQHISTHMESFWHLYAFDYTQLYGNGGSKMFTYFPATLLPLIPLSLVFGDSRYGLVCINIFVVFVILLSKNIKNRYASLLLLSLPISSFILEVSFTEPTVLLYFAIMVLFLIRRSYIYAAIAAGLLLSTKHYIWICLPYFLVTIPKKYVVKCFCTAVGILILTCLPFIVVSPSSFIRSLFIYFISLTPRIDGLSLFGFLSSVHISYISTIPYVILLISISWMFWLLRRKQIKPIAASAVTLLLFFTFNQFAFPNYFYIISQIFILSVVFDSQVNVFS